MNITEILYGVFLSTVDWKNLDKYNKWLEDKFGNIIFNLIL